MTSNVDLTGVSNFSSFSTNVAVQAWNMSYTDSNNTGKIQVVGFGYQNETNSYSTYFRRDVRNSSFDTAIILSQEAIDEGEKYVGKTFSHVHLLVTQNLITIYINLILFSICEPEP